MINPPPARFVLVDIVATAVCVRVIKNAFNLISHIIGRVLALFPQVGKAPIGWCSN
jgi:hypothetical protein